jgi:hypothetical protein
VKSREVAVMKIIVSSFLAVLLLLPACGAKKEEAAKPQKAPNPWAELNFEYAIISPTSAYPLTTCCVCGKELATLPQKPVVVAYQNYEARLCDMECMKKFDKDPEGIIVTKINPRAIFNK